MWIVNPRANKVKEIIYQLHREEKDNEKSQALWIACLLIEKHERETEQMIKDGITAIKQLNGFGRFLTRFFKIREEVK